MMTDLRLPLLVLALNLVALGCDAPEKSVGQESDSGSTETSGCDETCTTGGESETGGVPETSATGDLEDCPGIGTEDACIDQGCTWYETTQITDDCESSPGSGVCTPTLPPVACDGPRCGSNDIPYWTREVSAGVWEVVAGSECAAPQDGFSLCEFAGDDPAACACVCPSTATSLPPGFETELGAAGCVDMHVYGNSPDGSIAIVLATGPGFTPVADAVAAGEPVSTTHDVSAFERLSVLVGTNVTFPQCNDAIDENAYSIDQEWVATAGTVTIEIAPELDAPKFGTQGYATVTITGLEVTLGGVTESVGEVTFADVAVGWLPG